MLESQIRQKHGIAVLALLPPPRLNAVLRLENDQQSRPSLVFSNRGESQVALHRAGLEPLPWYAAAALPLNVTHHLHQPGQYQCHLSL